MPDKDRRASRRFIVSGATVECQAPSLIPLIERAPAPPQPVLNLGAGGVEFLTKDPPNVDDKIDATIRIPEHAVPLKTRAAIKWVKAIEGQPFFRVAATFLGLPPSALATLRSLERSRGPDQQEGADAVVEGLDLSDDGAARLRELVAESVHVGPPPHDEPQAPTPSPEPVDSPEAIDRLLSDAISKQETRAADDGTATKRDQLAPEGLELIGAQETILRTKPLAAVNGGRVDIERRVSRLLQVFFGRDANFRAYQLTDDSMTSVRRPSFGPGSVVVFTLHHKPRSGDFALVEVAGELVFRQVFIEDEVVRLRPLNPRYPEVLTRLSKVKAMSRLAGRYEAM